MPSSKQAKTENNVINNNNNIYNIHALQTGTKYKLLDDMQKDRIVYLKSTCIDLLVNRFEAHESISNSIQFSAFQFNSNSSLSKMVARALDLLRYVDHF